MNLLGEMLQSLLWSDPSSVMCQDLTYYILFAFTLMNVSFLQHLLGSVKKFEVWKFAHAT